MLCVINKMMTRIDKKETSIYEKLRENQTEFRLLYIRIILEEANEI